MTVRFGPDPLHAGCEGLLVTVGYTDKVIVTWCNLICTIIECDLTCVCRPILGRYLPQYVEDPSTCMGTTLPDNFTAYIFDLIYRYSS